MGIEFKYSMPIILPSPVQKHPSFSLQADGKRIEQIGSRTIPPTAQEDSVSRT